MTTWCVPSVELHFTEWHAVLTGGYVVLCRAVPCRAVLCCAVLFCVVLCCAVPCRAVLPECSSGGGCLEMWQAAVSSKQTDKPPVLYLLLEKCQTASETRQPASVGVWHLKKVKHWVIREFEMFRAELQG